MLRGSPDALLEADDAIPLSTYFLSLLSSYLSLVQRHFYLLLPPSSLHPLKSPVFSIFQVPRNELFGGT